MEKTIVKRVDAMNGVKYFFYLLLIVIYPILGYAQETDYYYYGVVKNVNSTLNVRESASTQAKVVGQLQKGDTVPIKSCWSNETWYEIRTEKLQGFVNAKFIEKIVNPEIVSRKKAELEAKRIDEEDYWKHSWEFVLLFLLTVFLFILGYKSDDVEEGSSEKRRYIVLMRICYGLMFALGLILLTPIHRDLTQEVKCWITYDHWFRHAVNVVMLTVYTLFFVFISLAVGRNFVPNNATSEDMKYLGTKYYIWLCVIATITLYNPTLIVAYFGFLIWKTIRFISKVKNFELIVFLQLLLGVGVSIVFAFATKLLLTQIFIIILYALAIPALLGGAKETIKQEFSSSSSKVSSGSDDDYNSYNPDDEYDIKIEGGGIMGSDLKAKYNNFSQTEARDETGSYWKKNDDGTWSKE